MRPGPFKETLSWYQDPIGNQPVVDVGTGHVRYTLWMKNILHPEDEAFKNEVVDTVKNDAGDLYQLWTNVCQKKHQVLADMWSFDIQKIGYVTVADFQQALRLALSCSMTEADILLNTVPQEGRCGSIDYRRWLTEFCRSPRVDWQGYNNVSLLAQGLRHVDLEHAGKAIQAKALTEHELRLQAMDQERLLQMTQMDWKHEQIHRRLHEAPTHSLHHQHPMAALHAPSSFYLP